MSWDDIPEQEPTKSLLQKQLKRGELSHAYLLLGAEGTGKKDMALELAAASLCQSEGQETDSCGSCLSCEKIAHDNHPDVNFFAPPEDKKQMGIDTVRELRRRLALKPFAAMRRFFIIEEADHMTEQAANSLLKSLEEPPEYAVLLLLAKDESSLLPTILSRCQKLRLHSLSLESIVSLLRERGIKSEPAQHLARLSAGSPGRALSLAESDDLLRRREDVLDFLCRLTGHDDLEIFAEAERWRDWLKEDFPLLDLLMEWYRDIIVCKQSGAEAVRNRDYSSDIERMARAYSLPRLQDMLESVREAAGDIEANVRPELSLQVLLFDLKELQHSSCPRGG